MGDVRLRRDRSRTERLEQRDPANGGRKHRALEIFREFLGEEHSCTVTVRDNLKSLANVQGRGEPGSD